MTRRGNVTARDQHLGQRRPSKISTLGFSHGRLEQERARQRDACKWIILIGRERALETRAVCWCARQNVHFEDESEGSSISISIPITLRSTASAAPTDYHTLRRRKIGESAHGAFYFSLSGSSIFLWTSTWRGTISGREGDGDELQMETRCWHFPTAPQPKLPLLLLLLLKHQPNGFFWALCSGWEVALGYVNGEMHKEIMWKLRHDASDEQ